MGEIGKGLGYVTSTGGILKIVELALLAIAGGVVGYFYKEFSDSDYKKKDAIEFFLAAVGIAAGVAIIFFLIFLTGIHKKINLVWTKTAVGIFVLMAVLLVVASGMLAEVYKYFKDEKVCDILKTFDRKAQCKYIITGVAFGFLSAVVYVADAVVHFKM